MPTTRFNKMTEKLFNEGIIRLRTSVVVSILVIIISAVFAAGIGWEKVQARLRHLDGKTDVYASRFDELSSRVTTVESGSKVLEARFNAIESILKDIQTKVSK